MNDSALYTGVDGDIRDGIFGNENIDKDTEKLLQDQRQLVAELTPKLQSILTMLDNEIDLTIKFITDYVDNTKDSSDLMLGEIKAAARYRKYLGELKTKFTLALNEAHKK